MTLWKWSTTAASNGTADSTCPFPEGQAPSTLNDGTRGMMAAVAKWRNDITGINVTGGSGAAYTLSSNQVITANTDGFTVQFTPGATNTGAVTLSVDGQTAKPLRFLTGVDLPAGVLISGSLYQASYRSASSEWLLRSFDASIYSIPIGGGIDFWGAAAPNPSFALAQGQAISRTTYATLFSLFGTTYGTGDGSTTFNIPDKVGRVSAMVDGSAARLTTAGFGTTPVLGAVGGLATRTLTAAQIPSLASVTAAAITVNFGGNVPRTAGSISGNDYNNGSGALGPNFPTTTAGGTGDWVAISAASTSGAITSNYTNGSQNPVATIQPTIICNYILRVA